MGAISAIFSKTSPVEPATAQKMLSAAPHRGRNVKVLQHGHALVAVSASADRADAWLSQRDGLVAAFAGVLDNRAELTKRLKALGHPVEETNPAELLLSMFRALGHDAPKLLRGVFTGVVTDGSEFIAFRDHLGFGPLFYREDDRALSVASEAKQVVAGAGLAFEPDTEVVERIFFKRLDDETPCALKGVSRLPKGSLISIAPGRNTTVRRYWHPEELLETASSSDNDLRGRFEELMTQAVARTLTGEDIIAISGGIDSNAVAAFAAPIHLNLMARPIPALSQVFPEFPGVDERRYAEQVAAYLGLSLHTYTSSAAHFDRLDYWVRLTDGPPLAMLEEIAHEHRVVRDLGFRTILTGEFGEFVYDIRGHLLTHLMATRRYAALWERLRAPRSRRPTWKSDIRAVLAAFAPQPLALAYKRLTALGADPRVPDWVEIPKRHRAYYRNDPRVPPQRQWREGQLVTFHGPGIGVESAETCAAVHGVSVRRPLCDVDLWEFFLSLPAEIKFPDTRSKTLIRRLLRGKLPDVILDRSDKTFFDDYVLSRIDYPVLQQWLLGVPYRMPGVHYQRLRERLERRDFTIPDYVWARDLAAIHAFMSLW